MPQGNRTDGKLAAVVRWNAGKGEISGGVEREIEKCSAFLSGQDWGRAR